MADRRLTDVGLLLHRGPKPKPGSRRRRASGVPQSVYRLSLSSLYADPRTANRLAGAELMHVCQAGRQEGVDDRVTARPVGRQAEMSPLHIVPRQSV